MRVCGCLCTLHSHLDACECVCMYVHPSLMIPGRCGQDACPLVDVADIGACCATVHALLDVRMCLLIYLSMCTYMCVYIYSHILRGKHVHHHIKHGWRKWNFIFQLFAERDLGQKVRRASYGRSLSLASSRWRWIAHRCPPRLCTFIHTMSTMNKIATRRKTFTIKSHCSAWRASCSWIQASTQSPNREISSGSFSWRAWKRTEQT